MEPKQGKPHLRCIVVVCGFLLGIIAHNLFAETPIKALEETLSRIQAISRDPGLGDDSKTEQVWGIVVDRFDFREMSKRILGPYWEQNLEKQDEFVGAFTEFTKRTYFKQIEKLRDMKMTCLDEQIHGSMAKVLTTLEMPGTELKVKFHMHPFGSAWKIYDVVLENDGFSVIGNYKTQLHSILRAISFDQLLSLIRAKNL
jgi:phospholipid transport system substrate-binding protein